MIAPPSDSDAVLSGRHVQFSNEVALVGSPRQVEECKPEVQILREGDVIQAIDVICTCGQRIRVRCVYK